MMSDHEPNEEQALQARSIDVNGLIKKMDKLRKKHLLLTRNAGTGREQYNSKDNKECIHKTVQTVSNILLDKNPSFISGCFVQHLHNMVLDHICFIGAYQLAVLDEVAVLSFLRAFVSLFEMDNEENCLLGFKIILKIFEHIDLTVATRLGAIIVNQLEKFFTKIMECYKDISFKMCLKTRTSSACKLKTLLENLHSPIVVATSENNQKIMVLPKASKSLHALAEAPQVLNHILELWYKGYSCGLTDENWKAVVETFLRIINLKCDEKLRENPDFSEDAYLVFLDLQISSLEFLIYLQLLFKEISKHEDIKILSCRFLSLLKSCPPNATILQRKLVKVFHVILTKMGVTEKDYLIQHLWDDFLCHKAHALCNDVRASYFNSLLAYFGEVHHKLTKEDFSLIIKIFLHIMNDSSLPVEIQNTICFLLVKLQEKCRQGKADKKLFSVELHSLEILQAFNMRLKVFVESDLPFIREKLKNCETFFDSEDYCRPDFSYYYRARNPSSNFISDFKKLTNMKSIDESKNSFTIQSCKNLIQNIFQGVYAVAGQCGRSQKGCQNYRQPFSDFLKYSLQVMSIYCVPSKSYITPDVTLKKHHELLQFVAEIFILLPPIDIPKIFSPNINILLGEMRQDPSLRVFLQIILLNFSSGELIAVFLDFLLKHLEDFDDKEKSPTLFSLLDVIVVSLTKLDAKEEILEIYLLHMIGKCMKLTPTAKEPCNFLKIIHQLILAGYADDSETDIGRCLYPSLPSFIQTLHFWYKTSTNPDFSNLALQVSTTILSSCSSRLLIPNSSIVMLLVVEALKKNVPELTINAMKILQRFEHLEKSLVNIIMSFSKLEIANGLQHTLSSGLDGAVECAFSLLTKYYSSQHISSQFKYGPLTFTSATNIRFKHSCTVTLPVDKIMESAFQISLQKPASSLLLKECLKVMKYYLSCVFNQDCSGLLEKILSSNFSLNFANQSVENAISDFDAVGPLDSHRFILMGILDIASYKWEEETLDEISKFFEQCIKHYTVQCLLNSEKNGIDSFIIVDAISSFMSFCSGSDIEIKACIEKSLKALEIFVETSERVIGTKMWELPLFEQIWEKVCLLCYETSWYTQNFACKAMQLFINKCPVDWKCSHLTEFIKHLLNVMEISSPENSLECHASTLAGTILQDTFSIIEENLKDFLIPVLEISVSCLFKAMKNQGMRLYNFLRERSLKQIQKNLPHVPQIKQMLNEDLSRIDKWLESVPLKSKVGILDGILFFLDVCPQYSTEVLEKIVPRGVKYLTDSCNFVLDGCIAFSKISNDHTDFCKRVFKVLFSWCKESSAVELLNKALQCNSYELCSTAFECSFQLDVGMLPIRKWLEDSAEQLHLSKTLFVGNGNENARENEFPTNQDLYYLKRIRHMWCLLALLKDDIQQKDQEYISFILQEVLNCLQRSSDFSLELKWRRILKDTFFVLDDVKEVLLDVSSVFKFNPERVEEFFIGEFLKADNYKRKHISFSMEHLFHGNWAKHLHLGFLRNNNILNWMLCGGQKSRKPKNGVHGKLYSDPNELTYFAIEIIHNGDEFILKDKFIVNALQEIWSILEEQDKLFPRNIHSFPRFKQHIKLAVLLMRIYKLSNEAEDLFKLLKAPVDRFPEHFRFLTDFLKVEVIEKQSDHWKKKAFVKFVSVYAKKLYSADLETKILENLIIPSFISMKKQDFFLFQTKTDEEINEDGSKTDDNINKDFQLAVLACFEELTKSECKIKRPLLQLSCLLLYCACNNISEDFRKEFKKFTEFHIPQAYSDQSFYDPLIKCYWDLFSVYMLKIVKEGFNLNMLSKILQNSLSSYTPDVREVSTCTFDTLIPIMSSKTGGGLFYVHWTSVILEDSSLSICRLHSGYKNKKKECLARRIHFEHIFHAIVNNSEEYILHPGFMLLLLDVIIGMENIDKVKYICETFEMILDYILANKKIVNLNSMKWLLETASSIAKKLFELEIFKPENPKIGEMGSRKITNICKKIHLLDAGFIKLYPDKNPETRIVENYFIEYLRRFSVNHCVDFILHVQNVDCKMYFEMDPMNLLVFFSETSKMASFLKSGRHLKQVQTPDIRVAFFKATDAYLKMCFWQPENSVPLDEFPDFPIQDYEYLKERVLDLKEVIEGFMNFFSKMLQNLSLPSKQKLRKMMILYINEKLIKSLLHLEKLMKQDLDPNIGKDPSTSHKFLCNCVYHTASWGILKLAVNIFPECITSFEFAELVKKVLQDSLEASTVTSSFNTDEAKLIITLQIIEFEFHKIYACGEIKKLLVKLAEVIKSKEIFITILNIIREWFIKDLQQDICIKDELLNLVMVVDRLPKEIKSKEILITVVNMIRKWFIKDLQQDNCVKDELLNFVVMVSNRVETLLEFSKDYQVYIEHFKLMELIYSYFASEYQYEPFSFESVVLHSGIPKDPIKFIHMYNSFSLNDIMKHLPHVGLWKSIPFSLAHCFEPVTSTVVEKQIESSYVDLVAESSKKKLDILNDIKSFTADISKITSSSFFNAVLKLSEVDDSLLKDLWNKFPELWSNLLKDNERQKGAANEFVEFQKQILSQVLSKEAESRLRTISIAKSDYGKMLENMIINMACTGQIESQLADNEFVHLLEEVNCQIKHNTPTGKFVGAFPNLSKKIFLTLEDFILENSLSEIPESEIYLQWLMKAYFELRDYDLLSGFHHQYSRCPELCAGIVLHNLGDYHEALDEYNDAMKRKIVESIENEFEQAEMDLLISYRIKCVKQLGDWDDLKETNGYWEIKDTGELSKSCKDLERVFQENTISLSDVSPKLKALSYNCIEELKSLSPCLFTPNHIHLLQTGRIVLEFEKAFHLRRCLQNFEFLGIVNVFQWWFNNMPSVKDDLSFWNTITSHRLNQLEFYESCVEKVDMGESHKLKMKNIAQLAKNSCIKALAKAMYVHSLPNMCVKLLQKDNALIVDEEIMELYLESLLLEMKFSKNDDEKNKILQKKANDFLQKEFPEIATEAAAMRDVYKGLVLSKMKEGNGNKENERIIEEIFSESYENLTTWSKGWLYCGNFFEKRFNSGDEMYYAYALRSFIMSCKYDQNITSMKPLEKIVWLLSFSSGVPNLRNNIIGDITQIPTSYWLPWIPQLLAAFLRIKDCRLLSYILHDISFKHPDSVFFIYHSVMSESECEEHLTSCLKIMDNMEVKHPVLISALKKIEKEFILLSEKIKPNVLIILRKIEVKICDLLFLCASKEIATESIDKKIQDIFIESLSYLESDPELRKKIYDLLNTSEWSLENILWTLSKCIRSYTVKKKKNRRSFALDPWSFLSSISGEQVEIFSSFMKHQPCVFISRILPKIDVIERNGKPACRIFIEGSNGKVYPYAIMAIDSMTSSMQESCVFQLFSFLNDLLEMETETYKRLLKFSVPGIIPIQRKVLIVEDDVSSVSLLDIFEMNYTKIEENDLMTPLLSLYHELYLRMLFSLDDIQIHAERLFCTVQEHIVSRKILKEEFRNRSPSDYYELRKRFSRDISLYYFAQLCFSLNQRIPEKFYIHQNDGKVTNFGLIFNNFYDVADPSFSQDVPFLMTPNISTFITPIGILGYVKLAMCATARCLYRHNEKIESVLRAICLNETADCLSTDTNMSFDHQKICSFVDSVTKTVEGLADIRGFGCKIEPFIAACEDCTTLSMTLPSFYPWF